jgi:hypothetical protein
VLLTHTQEALDLPDKHWDVMTRFVALLEELDVRVPNHN